MKKSRTTKNNTGSIAIDCSLSPIIGKFSGQKSCLQCFTSMSQRDDFILCFLISKNQNEGENCAVAEMEKCKAQSWEIIWKCKICYMIYMHLGCTLKKLYSFLFKVRLVLHTQNIKTSPLQKALTCNANRRSSELSQSLGQGETFS